MPKFCKKPIVVDAFQWNPEGPLSALPSWFTCRSCWDFADGFLVIDTLEGRMRVNPGDWVIKGTKSELYPCKPDIFAAIYDPVESVTEAGCGSDC